MVRRVALPADASDVAWTQRLRALGFTAAEITVIFSEVATADRWCRSGASQHLLQMMVELHTNSWVTVEGTAAVVACRAGTLVGTPLADIMFTLRFAACWCVFRSN